MAELVLNVHDTTGAVLNVVDGTSIVHRVLRGPVEVTGGGGGGVADHGALTGLGDDDHPQYQLVSAKNQPNGYPGLDGDGTIPDNRIPSSIARDTEVTAAVSSLSTVYQPLDSDLTAIAALSTTSFGRSLLALADAAAGRTALGLGTAATAASGDFQPVDSDLTAIAALSTTSFGRSLLTQADAAAARATLGVAGVVSDTIWDAAGDLVYGTGADTATRLPLGTRGQALVAGATAPEWAFITPRLNVPMATNDWVLLSTGFGTGSMGATIGGTATSSNNNSRYVPFFVGKRIGVNGLGIEVSTGNAGGSAVIRLGIHANNAGRPGSVVVDAGTASAGAAAKELSFTEVFLDPGWYFAVVVFQDLDTAGTNPAVRGAAAMGSTATRTSVPAASTQQVSWSATVSGALSANPTVINTGAIVIPHIWLKVSTL